MSQIAKFSFKGYRVLKSLIDIEEFQQDDNNKIDIDFQLAGINNTKEKTFELKMLVNISDVDKTLQIQVLIASLFEFEIDNSKDYKLDNYFILNAPAIVFPYVRAYISTLSSLSGLSNPIMLPTLNLTSEAKKLKENIKTI